MHPPLHSSRPVWFVWSGIVLVGLLAHARPSAAKECPRIIGRNPAAALVCRLQDPDLDVRQRAAAALGELGADGAPAVPALVKAQRGTHEGLRAATARAH